MTHLLLHVRRWFYKGKFKFVGIAFLLMLICVALGVIADSKLDFTVAFNTLRVFIVVPAACLMFILGYCVMLINRDAKVARGVTYKPLKSVWSPAWRLRFAAVVATFLLVLSYSTARTVVYTFATSVILSVGLGLIYFVTRTKQETFNDKYGIPDERDFDINKRLAEDEARREEVRAERRASKEKAKAAKQAERDKLKKALM